VILFLCVVIAKEVYRMLDISATPSGDEAWKKVTASSASLGNACSLCVCILHGGQGRT